MDKKNGVKKIKEESNYISKGKEAEGRKVDVYKKCGEEEERTEV